MDDGYGHPDNEADKAHSCVQTAEENVECRRGWQ